MGYLKKILEYNSSFVEKNKYEDFKAGKFPAKRIAVVSCMDPRLVELLPKAMDLKNGDAVFIKVAGAQVSNNFDSVIRSLLIAIYELHVEEIFIIGHHNCGAQHLSPEKILKEINVKCGNVENAIQSDHEIRTFLSGFGDLEESVKKSVSLVKQHPFIPDNVLVHGLIIDPETGRLEVIVANQ